MDVANTFAQTVLFLLIFHAHDMGQGYFDSESHPYLKSTKGSSHFSSKRFHPYNVGTYGLLMVP